jgi:hypothetical protein
MKALFEIEILAQYGVRKVDVEKVKKVQVSIIFAVRR